VDSQGRYTMPNVYTTTTWNVFNFSSTKSNFSSPPFIGLKAIRLDKNATKTVNMPLYPADPGNGMITGKVVDSTTNLGIAGVTVIITLDAAAPNVTQTTAADGTYTLSPVTMGSGSLKAAKTNYIQTSNNQPIVSFITPNQIITMKPTGLISGRVTNNTTSAGIDDIQLVAKNSAGGGDTKAVTVGGGYYSLTVTAGDTYSVEAILDNTQYRCVFPAGKKCVNINVGTGTSVANQNLRLDYNYNSITGSLSISNPTGVDTLISNGALIIAQPVANTIPAQGVSGGYFSSIAEGKEQNAFFRTVFPSFTAYANQDGTYKVMVPVYGGNYDVYAYYTYTSINANVIVDPYVQPPKYLKIRTNYFKKITATAPGSTGVNFTGSWTAYP
jgi:hypothetical protein